MCNKACRNGKDKNIQLGVLKPTIIIINPMNAADMPSIAYHPAMTAKKYIVMLTYLFVDSIYDFIQRTGPFTVCIGSLCAFNDID